MLCTADDPVTPVLVIAFKVFMPGFLALVIAVVVAVFWKKLSKGWRLYSITFLLLLAGVSLTLAFLLAGNPCPGPNLPTGFVPHSEA